MKNFQNFTPQKYMTSDFQKYRTEFIKLNPLMIPMIFL